MIVDDIYKRLDISAADAKAGIDELIVFASAEAAARAADWLGFIEVSIWEATDGFLLGVNGYFLNTSWTVLRQASIDLEYRLV